MPTEEAFGGDEEWAEAGRVLRARLAELGFTRKELASRADVDVNTIREMLSGMQRHRSPDMLARVSNALGWPPDRLAKLLRSQPQQARVDARLDAIEQRLTHIEESLNTIVRILEQRG